MFNTQILKTQPSRYATIASAVLPPLLILIIGGTVFNPGKSAGTNVVGRPVPIVFGIVWFLITVMLLLALVISALNVESIVALSLITVFCVLSTVLCFAWLIVYKTSKPNAAQVLLLAFVLMFATTLVSVSCNCQENAKITSSLFFGLATAWLSIASLLNYVEINK